MNSHPFSCLKLIFKLFYPESLSCFLGSSKGQPSNVRRVILLHRHFSSILKNENCIKYNLNQFLNLNIWAVENNMSYSLLYSTFLASSMLCTFGRVTDVNQPHPFTKSRTLSASLTWAWPSGSVMSSYRMIEVRVWNFKLIVPWICPYRWYYKIDILNFNKW